MSSLETLHAEAADSPADTTVGDAARRRSILVTVCVALMAVIAAVTGLNVAQPHLALDLGASQSQVLWMINIYAISLASLLLPSPPPSRMQGRVWHPPSTT